MKKRGIITIILCALLCFANVAGGSASLFGPNEVQAASTETKKAVYLGVDGYGTSKATRENLSNFKYRFQVNKKVKIYSINNGKKSGGEYQYPIQNKLKVGYKYEIKIKDDVIQSAKQITAPNTKNFNPPVSGEPGKKTLKNLLQTALAPVGTALYIYGGGWNWQDDAASVQAKTIGVSPDWIRFFKQQDTNFTYKAKNPKKSFYPYGEYNAYYYAGLDCSGYIGWALYNTFNTTSGKEGYVEPASVMAKHCADRGWGEWTHTAAVPDGSKETRLLPGDIISISGHVWMALGTCEDGSIVIIHATPTDSRNGKPGGGVQLSSIGASEDCEAYKLADQYMSTYFPKWYERYPVANKDAETYFAFEGDNTGLFRWSTTGENGGLTDPEGYQKMAVREVLADLFE